MFQSRFIKGLFTLKQTKFTLEDKMKTSSSITSVRCLSYWPIREAAMIHGQIIKLHTCALMGDSCWDKAKPATIL